jgi:probable HAF family extracellular repeat protein
MKRLSLAAFAMFFSLVLTAMPLQAHQQTDIHGCYQKNNGRLRIVTKECDCKNSEETVSWGLTGSTKHAQKKAGSEKITELQTLGGTQNFASAINDQGEILGSSSLAGDGDTHAFEFGKGRVTDLFPVNLGTPTAINNKGEVAGGLVVGGVFLPVIYDSLDQKTKMLGSLGGITSSGFSGVATSLNNTGEAVGFSYIDGLNRHAFLFSNGLMKDIGSFGGYSGANAINDPGTIVGFASNLPNGVAHAFLYRNGTMTDINPFGGSDFGSSESYAEGINNRDEVVGQGLVKDRTSFHAFLYRNGNVTDLGTLPGGRNSYGNAINQRGQVVGTADVPYIDTCIDFETGQTFPCTKYKLEAFLYDNGTMINLNSLIPSDSGWELVSALDINTRGEIVGYGLLDGRFRAFVLK